MPGKKGTENHPVRLGFSGKLLIPLKCAVDRSKSVLLS